MRCRHTVPDWHRYVAPGNDAPPIYAACRLLIREGEPAAEPRAIACGYWGRQEACPLYEGPRASRARAEPVGAPSSLDIPVAVGSVWPVRAPGERDVSGLALVALNGASILALVVTAIVAVGVGARAAPWLLAAIGLSLATHILTSLRVWAGR